MEHSQEIELRELHALLTKHYIKVLEVGVLSGYDAKGEPVYVEPTSGYLNAINKFLSDNKITVSLEVSENDESVKDALDKYKREHNQHMAELEEQYLKRTGYVQ